MTSLAQDVLPPRVSQNGTPDNGKSRVYGGDCKLVHIADGTRADVGLDVANFIEDTMLSRAIEEGKIEPNDNAKALCPGCYMIALFNAAIHLADANGQSLSELGNTMSRAFAELAKHPSKGLTEEIEVMLDND